MSIPFGTILSAFGDHAAKLGIFNTVNGAEPKSAPPNNGLHLALWVEDFGPDVKMTGLALTALRMTVKARIYSDAIQVDSDIIDPTVYDAAEQYLGELTGDFDLDGLIRHIDLNGRMGAPMGGKAGYITQDKTVFRVFEMTIPVALNQEWTQTR